MVDTPTPAHTIDSQTIYVDIYTYTHKDVRGGGTLYHERVTTLNLRNSLFFIYFKKRNSLNLPLLWLPTTTEPPQQHRYNRETAERQQRNNNTRKEVQAGLSLSSSRVPETTRDSTPKVYTLFELVIQLSSCPGSGPVVQWSSYLSVKLSGEIRLDSGTVIVP